MDLPHTRFSRAVDRFIERLGDFISWIWLLLLGIIVANVVLRYLFAEGRIEFEEIQWHLYSIGFLIGLSYAYKSDSHVRVDVVREHLSPRTVAWIELYGILILLLPFIYLICWSAIPFISYSFETAEVSEAPGGLSHRWVIKSFLLTGFLILTLGVISRLTRVWTFLFRDVDVMEVPLAVPEGVPAEAADNL
jgi:TRAP-type mannitol/chloroaromatic compound transport system permease small subunit